MRRRQFISLLAAAAAGPKPAKAQQGERTRRLGVLVGVAAETDAEGQARVAAFLKSVQAFGWIPGNNLRVEIRWSPQDITLIKNHAAELTALVPDAIVVAGNVGLAELHRLNRTTPIIFVNVSDPVGSGFVSSLARPDGNITGFENFEPAMGGKWIEILREVAPNVTKVIVLRNSETLAHGAFVRAAAAVAPVFELQLIQVDNNDVDEIDRAIGAVAAAVGGGMVVLPHPSATKHRALIIGLASRHRIPAIYPYGYFAQSGGLVSYGIDQVEQWLRAAGYVDQLLRGKKPSELPIQAPTKFELTINLKTAKALGLTVPPSLIARADEVIE